MSEELLKQFNLSDEEYLALDEIEFRARFRERIHHTLEIQTYAAANGEGTLSQRQSETAKKFIRLWKERNLPEDLPEYVYAQKLIGFSEKLVAGEKPDLDEFAPYPLTQAEKDAFFKVVFERRSVRHFTDEDVADELIDKILQSGLWAAHSCNLQSIRYLVIREKNVPGLFKGSDVPGGPVHLVVLQDERVYRANPFNPVRNRLIDAGAAAQNIVLATHALGLAGVWLTFNDAMIQRIGKHFDLPEHVKIVTYVDIGYPTQTPYAPQRLTLDEAVIANV
ncbi:MAG: nitroreductase family protein [Christensenellales bacterium]